MSWFGIVKVFLGAILLVWLLGLTSFLINRHRSLSRLNDIYSGLKPISIKTESIEGSCFWLPNEFGGEYRCTRKAIMVFPAQDLAKVQNIFEAGGFTSHYGQSEDNIVLNRSDHEQLNDAVISYQDNSKYFQVDYSDYYWGISCGFGICVPSMSLW